MNELKQIFTNMLNHIDNHKQSYSSPEWTNERIVNAYIKTHEAKLKKLFIPSVSQQRKTLEEFKKDYNKRNFDDANIIERDIELFFEKKKCDIPVVSKRFDFDKLLQDYRQDFVNGGGYSRSDKFENGTEPYEIFEWFKKKLS